MTLRTVQQYRDGLKDGRRVFYGGKRVADVTAHPELRSAIDHSALSYEISGSHPDLAVSKDAEDPYSMYYHVPRSADELITRGHLIEAGARLGAGTILLKEVGSDALFALLLTLSGESLEKATAYYQRCRDLDLALAVGQTDVKGDRSLHPHAQADPDLYVRIVDEDSDSITVRGAKTHTSYSANADEIVVLPTRAMDAADRDYAVAFAVPIDTPGLHIHVSPYLGAPRNEFDFPLSSRHKMVESLTVFEDVRVPRDRVFLARTVEEAGPLAMAFAGFHRFTSINYKLPLLDILIGSAILIAEANGIAKAGHVRDKLTELIVYTETVRSLAEMAAIRSRTHQTGVQMPDPLTANMARYHFGRGYRDAVATLIDLSGGLLVTGLGADDWAEPATRAVMEKYYAAAVPAERRLRLINLISDLTARDFGGYQSVLAVHGEGSLTAQELSISRSYDTDRAIRYVEALAGI
ncbi:Aromatic ring hydroxylase [Sinosporangium album]|uniref:Aromatic ring hydroxylase n=1 Tax=Sinosporangium album TaxID=504805 RepID=A0A1G8B6Y9_9ACTN|nr:4-hydroxyphenylacetate 3-hydroxylase N-terminal domain-containing protein [Sinosporangium album]SDH29012.1 Aromatic ring hydroxylase [Sinosporangium album]